MFHVLRRFRRLDRGIAILLVAGLVIAAARLPWRDWFPLETIAGTVRVIDGDSLYVGGREIRLDGIDAPELAQECRRDGRDWPCGRVARQALAAMAGRGIVQCSVRGFDRYGRALVRCEAQGRDLAADMVGAGHAVASDAYAAEEAMARTARRGLWSGTFERPAAWRERNPRTDG